MFPEPRLRVGILAGDDLHFALEGDFRTRGGNGAPAGEYRAQLKGDGIVVESPAGTFAVQGELSFDPADQQSSFVIRDVPIGVQFHWHQRQDQRFGGALALQMTEGTLTAVNHIPLELYLKSVISSEMSATGSISMLKAHAVTSRSWLLAQLARSGRLKSGAGHESGWIDNPSERLRWYDREDHRHFDVCADDHCQRYQGLTASSPGTVEQAVNGTRGLVLTSNGAVCDARFSKACGGITEAFENVWEPAPQPYLVPVRDCGGSGEPFPNLRDEQEAGAWIRSKPVSYCDATDPGTVGQVLVSYDRATVDFYRWRVEYGQDELASIVERKTGLEFGAIRSLTPVERGPSGRLIRLRIVGTKRTWVVGKELEIRRTLSATHLYSAAFIVESVGGVHGIPDRFILSGAGWGHGVGLCQIGAAVMGERGYSFEQILGHYFRGAEITRLYE